jgi:hypothetical protein
VITVSSQIWIHHPCAKKIIRSWNYKLLAITCFILTSSTFRRTD